MSGLLQRQFCLPKYIDKLKKEYIAWHKQFSGVFIFKKISTGQSYKINETKTAFTNI